MSEYASSKSYENKLVPASIADNKSGEVALFDSISELDNAHSHLHFPELPAEDDVTMSLPAESSPSFAEEGASIRLDERADAVSEIINDINIENRYDGAAKAAATPYSSFNLRNGNGTLSGMRFNAELAHKRKLKNIETLVAADALRRAGFDESWQNAVHNAVSKEIAQDAQPGKAPHRRREKMRKKAQRSARNSTL